MGPGPAQHQVGYGGGRGLGEGGGHPRRNRDAEAVPQPGHVLDDGDHVRAGDPDFDRSSFGSRSVTERRASEVEGSARFASPQLLAGERPGGAQ